MPRTGEDFFNSLSSFMRDTLYVSAASDEQRCGHIRPTHKKSLQTLNGLRGLSYFCLGVTEQPTKAPFFLFGVIFSCFAFINVCLWHLGQNRGKFFSSVSSRICTLVLLPQTGHSINFSFCIRHISSESQTQDCLSYCCQGKLQVPFALLLGL